MNTDLVNCKMGEPLVLDLGASAAGALPREIQWMPPGTHTVWPDGFEEAFPVEVTAAIAEKANGQLQEQRRLAASGKGNWPYIDFNHEDREQSGEPVRIFWGGEDPRSGGIRMEVNWSGSGERAVRSRDFRSFSPSWRMHKDTHAFLGVGLNMGGLVNRSAFKTIQAVARGHGAGHESGDINNNINKGQPMTEAEKQEITNLITGAVKPLTEQVTALAKLPERLIALEEKVNGKGAGDEEEADNIVKLVEASLKPMADRLKLLEDGDKSAVQANAKRTVQEIGVKAGRISSQDKETVEFWEGAIASNAKAADALLKMPVNPAFVQIIQAGAAGGTQTGTGKTAEDFATLVKAKATAGKKKSEALDLAMAENPEGYKAWREANGKPGI
jgi:hypothetical protein